MKKVNFKTKLALNKDTVTRLQSAQLNDIKGGDVQALSWFRTWCRGGQTSKVCCWTKQ